MRGYIVCVYKSIKDPEKLKKYATSAKSAVEKFNGKFLIRRWGKYHNRRPRVPENYSN